MQTSRVIAQATNGKTAEWNDVTTRTQHVQSCLKVPLLKKSLLVFHLSG